MVEINNVESLNYNKKTGQLKKADAPQKAVSVMNPENKIIDTPDISMKGKADAQGIAVLSDTLSTLAQNEDILKKIGAKGLERAAGAATSKGNAIMNGVEQTLKRYDKEIDAILNNNTLSEQDKQSKIAEIKEKQKAVVEEAQVKAQILAKLSNAITDFLPAYNKLKDAGQSTDELTGMLVGLINSIDPSPSNFDKAKDSKDIQKILKKSHKNIFGNGSADKLKENIRKIEEKIKNAKTEEEKSAFKMQKTLFEGILAEIEDIKLDENE